jgi:ketosteroid isomerase-like protein
MNKYLISSVCITLCTICFSQTQIANLYSQGDYQQCIDEGNKMLKVNTEDGVAHYFIGASNVNLQRYKAAEKYLLNARKYQYSRTIAVNVNLMRAFAGQKKTKEALVELTALANNGFRGIGFLSLPEFEYLSDNEEYQSLKNVVMENGSPCLYGKVPQKLDFWVGDWDVMVNGAKFADSWITKSEGGCTLYENYQTLRGFLGRSTNYFDATDSLYKQIWIDASNSITHYEEVEARDGYLRMQSPDKTARMTWEYNAQKDEVHQWAENSNDNGQTWSMGFDGLYVRKTVAIAAEIKTLFSQMEELFDKNQMLEIANFYTTDAQILEPGGMVYSGEKAIKEYWKSLDGKGVSWDLTVLEFENLGDDVVSVLATSELEHTLNGNAQMSKTKALILLKKTNDGYKIHRDFFHFIR